MIVLKRKTFAIGASTMTPAMRNIKASSAFKMNPAFKKQPLATPGVKSNFKPLKVAQPPKPTLEMKQAKAAVTGRLGSSAVEFDAKGFNNLPKRVRNSMQTTTLSNGNKAAVGTPQNQSVINKVFSKKA